MTKVEVDAGKLLNNLIDHFNYNQFDLLTVILLQYFTGNKKKIDNLSVNIKLQVEARLVWNAFHDANIQVDLLTTLVLYIFNAFKNNTDDIEEYSVFSPATISVFIAKMCILYDFKLIKDSIIFTNEGVYVNTHVLEKSIPVSSELKNPDHARHMRMHRLMKKHSLPVKKGKSIDNTKKIRQNTNFVPIEYLFFLFFTANS